MENPMQYERDKRDITQAHAQSLEVLNRRNRYRTLTPRAGIDFASNDYLGLANSPKLQSAAAKALSSKTPLGATGSRLLRGNHEEHIALENEAAQFFHSQGALFFTSGFIANYALFSTLPMRDDLVVHDELIHASVHDGLKAGKAQVLKARHNDSQSFQDAIRSWRASGHKGRVWISVESLYSMDGDCAPLDELQNIALNHDAFLIIDEAHATGVLGPGGRGLAARFEGAENIITMHTCGKALGVMGGLVCAPKPLIDYLINRSRAFIFATAPSPVITATVRAALKISSEDDTLRARLSKLVETAGRHLLKQSGIKPSGSQIQPIIVGSDENALQIAGTMQQNGFDVRAIRPPTVPIGKSRLRLSFTLNITPQQACDMIDKLSHELRRIEN